MDPDQGVFLDGQCQLYSIQIALKLLLLSIYDWEFHFIRKYVGFFTRVDFKGSDPDPIFCCLITYPGDAGSTAFNEIFGLCIFDVDSIATR